GDREHELLAILELLVALLGQFAFHADLFTDKRDVFLVDAHGAAFRSRALEVGRPLPWLGIDMADDRHGNDTVSRLQRDAAYADGVAAGKDADAIDREAYALAERRRQQDVVAIRAGLDGE